MFLKHNICRHNTHRSKNYTRINYLCAETVKLCPTLYNPVGCSPDMSFQMLKLDLEKAEEPEIKLPTCIGSQKKQENTIKTSTSALLITPKCLTVKITTNWKILQEMGISDHLTCLLKNLYTGQEATVGTRHGATDRFQIGKGVHEGCHPDY